MGYTGLFPRSLSFQAEISNRNSRGTNGSKKRGGEGQRERRWSRQDIIPCWHTAQRETHHKKHGPFGVLPCRVQP